jgi:regulator of nucleoside diphosphate kinase
MRRGTMAAICITEPDAERLGVLHRFVKTSAEGERLRRLEQEISEAELLDPEQVPPDLVTMNSRVLVRDVASGNTAEYTLVFPAIADARKKRLSVLGALGSALLGKRVGDVVEYTSSAGGERYLIVSVLYQPEAAGDYYG